MLGLGAKRCCEKLTKKGQNCVMNFQASGASQLVL